MLAVSSQHAYNWVGVVGGVLGVFGLVGAAIAVLRSTIATNTIKLLESENRVLRTQNQRQAQEIAELQATAKVLIDRVDAKAQLGVMNEKLDRLLERR